MPLVECYPGKLNQVFMNVLNNAIDAIENQKGTIKISTGIEKDMVTISIRDTGCGIREEDKPKVFDPFFTTKRWDMDWDSDWQSVIQSSRNYGGDIFLNQG
jgi:signal transduction histidine kinase